MMTRQKMPNLNNATPSYIVDLCAPQVEEMNKLKKLTDYLKTGLKARLTPDLKIDPLTYEVEGEDYTAVISTQTQERVDVNKVRALLTEEQLAECITVLEVTTVRFVKNEKITAKAAIRGGA